MSDLHRNIISSCELHNKNFRGLKQLRIEELRKVGNSYLLVGEGKINEYGIQSNDVLLYQVDSQDIWVKISLECKELQNTLHADLDIKIEKNLSQKEFDRLLQKLAINIWNRCCPLFSYKYDAPQKSLKFVYKEDQHLTTVDFENASMLYVLTSI